MSDNVQTRLAQSKGWLRSHAARVLDALAYARWAPAGWAAQRRMAFWERMAAPIHEQWGRGEWDFPVLERIIQEHRVTSVLDIGCGTGRLFPLYQRLGVGRVLGVDISAESLAIACRDYPDVPTLQARIEDAGLPSEGFDLVVSNRVLQHIGRDAIAAVIGKLCATGRLIYLNELSDSDGLPEEFFMFRHDYDRLLAQYGFGLLEAYMLDWQTYQLYAPDTI